MSYQMKLLKHMERRDPSRVKDYLCAGFDTFDPTHIKNHPAIDIIRDAEKMMREEGWKVGGYDWGPGKGRQYTCVSPNGEWYRSHYPHDGKEVVS